MEERKSDDLIGILGAEEESSSAIQAALDDFQFPADPFEGKKCSPLRVEEEEAMGSKHPLLTKELSRKDDNDFTFDLAQLPELIRSKPNNVSLFKVEYYLAIFFIYSPLFCKLRI